MPVKSEKQRRFMYASLASKTDVPPSVAKKFVGPKAHSQGGALKEPEMKESKKMVGKELAFMKKKGAPKEMIKHEMAEAKGGKYAKGGGIESKGKTKGKVVKMAMGGFAAPMPTTQASMQAAAKQQVSPQPETQASMQNQAQLMQAAMDKAQRENVMREAMSGQNVGRASSSAPAFGFGGQEAAINMQMHGNQPANRSAGAFAASDPRQQAISRANEQIAQQRAAERAAAQRAQEFARSQNKSTPAPRRPGGFAKGGAVDGCAQRGKTKGRYI